MTTTHATSVWLGSWGLIWVSLQRSDTSSGPIIGRLDDDGGRRINKIFQMWVLVSLDVSVTPWFRFTSRRQF